MNEVTQVLAAMEKGDPSAANLLLPLVYNELRRLAQLRLTHEKPGQTLQATALVHEAWLRLVGDGAASPNWNSRGHFYAAAAESMRRILVEAARRKNRVKHGGEFSRIELDDVHPVATEIQEDILALDAAMTKLAAEDPQAAELVQLRYFGGVTFADIAVQLGISTRTAERIWAYSRAWLRCEMENFDKADHI